MAQPKPTGAAGTSGPDPTQYTYTPVDTSKSDAFQNNAINSYNSTGDWAKQAGLNALSASERGANENAARAGLKAGGASYLASNAQGQVQGINALNQQMSNWAQGASQVYQGAANNALNTATTNAAGINAVNQGNADYARTNLQNQQQANSAASTANIQSATNQYNAHKGWTGTSAAAGAWNNAMQAYNDAVAKGDTAGAQAALAQLNNTAGGSGYTADGHNRNDPKLKNRADRSQKQPDGSTWYYKYNSVIGKEDASGNFTYTGT